MLHEVGTDIGARFPSDTHLCLWIGLVPRQNESGKRISSKTLAKATNTFVRHSLKLPIPYADPTITRVFSTEAEKAETEWPWRSPTPS
ncbi:transposase [Paenibacillus polymyxa]|uniref:transposase n=1 Tax=Paenibacillus polymyxa TaxID=1406 RepID=UPI0039FD3DD1